MAPALSTRFSLGIDHRSKRNTPPCSSSNDHFPFESRLDDSSRRGGKTITACWPLNGHAKKEILEKKAQHEFHGRFNRAQCASRSGRFDFCPLFDHRHFPLVFLCIFNSTGRSLLRILEPFPPYSPMHSQRNSPRILFVQRERTRSVTRSFVVDYA